MSEIYRLLKPGGVCYFGARNKYAIIEPQYNLPFLSWLPKIIANKLVVLTNRGQEFVGDYRSYYGLRKLVEKFEIHDFTLKILADPGKYNFVKLSKYKKVLKFIPFRFVTPFIPNYIWILEKIN
jgi:SAM-dependent methyltransferase